MQLRKLTGFIFAVVLLAPVAARAQMPRSGFVAEGRLAVGTPGNVIPSIAAGGRLIGRIQIEGGFNITRGSHPTGADGTEDATTFTFGPILTVDILKSSDEKVAWYGKGGMALGVNVHTVSAGNTSNSTNLFALGYDLALGVRYCPHPNFAAGVEGGINGLFIDPAGHNTAGSGTTSFYGALVGTFYWGK